MKTGGRAKLYDLAAALPLVAWYGFGLWRDLPDLVEKYHSIHNGSVDLLLVGRMLARLSYIAFAAFLIALLILRVTPVCKSVGLMPRLMGVLGTFATVGFLYLPAANLSLLTTFIATFLIVSGMALAIYTLLRLGRSFSIVPEARQLVTSGPYAVVRHPLYAFEEIAIIGTAMQFVQPWSLLLLIAHFALQLARMHYEERVLAQAFPEYAAYAARTSRLIPDVY